MAESTSFHGNDYASIKGGTVENDVFQAVRAEAI
jgi:hypothetical protein